jgi:hypothetical protein
MEILAFALILVLIGALSIDLGKDSRPSEDDHARNW